MTNKFPELDGVITYIQSRLDEPLELNMLAKYAGYSPYHFARIFKARMGLPPLYYVSSLRLHRAKELLLHTNLSIRDISLEIGQQSLGTFTSRFTEKVGVTPSLFRNSRDIADNHLNSLKALESWYDLPVLTSPVGTVEGSISFEVPFEGVILIGLFAKPIPEGLPPYGTLISSAARRFRFTGVKPGTYYLLATSVSWGMRAADFLVPQTTLRAKHKVPVVVGPNKSVPFQRVNMRVPHPDDPPILISLPLLMNNFLHINSQLSNR
jgi:AraC-like DNA-binding protein